MNEDPLIGRQLGEYRIESLLGQGGMARIYLAVDVRLKRQVVLKLINPPSRNDINYITRFEREAQIIGNMDHPHIVRLYRFDEQDGWLYMAMQHIEGADLEVVLASYRNDGEFMDPDDVRRIVREVCSALDYAHGEGVIHRDVKPANILLDQEGRAYLGDFGLALITEIGTRGEIFGSAHYIAPEQAVSSAKAVPQSDLYSMGIILYEIFTGEVPFDAATPLDISILHISEPPLPPHQLRADIHPELEAVILKALAKKPEERYPTGAALADALDQALDARSAVTLLAPQGSVSRHTIPERVVLELGQQRLPPIPAAVATTPPPVDESVPVESGEYPENKRSKVPPVAIAGLGALVLMAFVCLPLVLLRPMLNRFLGGTTQRPGQTPTREIAQSIGKTMVSTSTSFIEKPSATSPVVMGTASPIVPSPTAIPVSYQLLIIRGQDNDSVIVVNQSKNAFPLELMSLGDAKKGVSGKEWGVKNLENGACVGVWKESRGNAKHKLPTGVGCDLVGKQLVRDKKDWFGEKAIVVNFDDVQFGVCDKDQKQCQITIAP